MAEEGEKRASVSDKFVAWFSELSKKDIPSAGGKGANLAEMYNHKFPIPPGFMITSNAYAKFIELSGLREQIKSVLASFDVEDTKSLEEASKKVRALIEKAEMPKNIEEEIIEAYDVLYTEQPKGAHISQTAIDILKKGREPPFVAVRSSATAEDLKDASFAGQQDSFLNVKGERMLIEKVKCCFSSLFTARAIYYRTKKGFEHDKVNMAVVVQKMVDSDKSGVMFSKDPVTHTENILIEAVWGLGEGIVSGMIKPDSYTIQLSDDKFEVLNEVISEKKIAIVRDSSGRNVVIKLNSERANQRVLTSYELKRLAQYAKELERHYDKPQDIEFAIEQKEIYIVQSRPITTLEKRKSSDDTAYQGEVLLSGLGASPGIASGKVKIVRNEKDLENLKKGEVLVTEMTNPDMVVGMQKSAAIITDEGGITSHAAIVSREMGIPAVVGTGKATSTLQDGEIVTVDGSNGRVFKGAGESKKIEILEIVPTKTKIKVIVDLPEVAERAAKSGAKSVGLVRLEGIIAESRKHPLAFVKENKIPSYIAHLAGALKKIAEHFEEIWIRTSDIRSDEYQHLDGAPKEVESNPMLGDHGIRFSLKNPAILKAEIMAVKELADEFSGKKFGIMIPQLISVEELKGFKEIAKEIRLPKNVKLGIMVETPAAVEIINELCEEGFDFLSFGTNDLTQYILAVDRNNPHVQDIYTEMHPAVLHAIEYVLRRTKKYNIETSACGQAASRREMAEFLVKEGIQSLSVNADAAYSVSTLIAEIEQGYESKKNESVVLSVPTEQAVKPEAQAESVEEVDQKEVLEIPVLKAEVLEEKLAGKDIEEAILEELEETKPAEVQQVSEEAKQEEPRRQEEVSDNYNPGESESAEKRDIPSLNDSITVEEEEIKKMDADKLLNIFD